MADAFTNLLHTTLATASGPEGGLWLPPVYSEQAGDVDWPFMFITWVCIFFFVLVVGLMVYFMWKYNRDRGVKPDHDAVTHLTWLEVLWSGIPLILVIAIFYVGFKGYMNLATAPNDAYTINVTAMKWAWSFQYPNGHITDELHVPAGEPIKLVMSSNDVLHAFYVPDFRVKQDVVPGRFSSLWFQAIYDPRPPTEDGRDRNVHHIFCAEYCGTSHSDMYAQVTVHPTREAYEEWLKDASNLYKGNPPLEAVGYRLYNTRGCKSCHTVDGADLIGPSLKATWAEVTGGQRQLSEGPPVSDTTPEEYIRESIIQPMARIVDGYPKSMPTFKSTLSAEDINALIAYIKWLPDNDESRDLWAEWKSELATRGDEE